MATYDQATDQALCRFGDGGDGTTFVAGGDITMNTGWNVGALTSGGGSPGNFELADLFVFDAAHPSGDIATHLISYARDIKGVA